MSAVYKMLIYGEMYFLEKKLTEAAFFNTFVIRCSGTLHIMKYFLFQKQKYLNEIYSKRF